MFSETCVSHSFHGGGWNLCKMSRPVWLPGPMPVILFMGGGVCKMSRPVWLPGPMFLPGGSLSWSYVPSRGVSVQGDLPTSGGLGEGGLCPGGSLCVGKSL